MSLIYGVPEMAEEEVLEQIAFQAVQYLRLDDPKYKKADTLSKILVAAKDKRKRKNSRRLVRVKCLCQTIRV